MRPGKTSAILYNANYADNGERKADPACMHNQGHYVTWRGFARAVVACSKLRGLGFGTAESQSASALRVTDYVAPPANYSYQIKYPFFVINDISIF